MGGKAGERFKAEVVMQVNRGIRGTVHSERCCDECAQVIQTFSYYSPQEKSDFLLQPVDALTIIARDTYAADNMWVQ